MPAKLNVHVSALSSQPETFWVTEERVAAACKRHKGLARHLRFDWSWDHDRFADGMAKADIMIGWRFPGPELRAMAPNLKWITLTGAGTEHLQPFDWVWPGLKLTNNSGVHAEKAAEFAGAAVLAMAHGLPFFATNKPKRRWEKRFTTTIEGGTAVVIGLGGMGGATARWLKQKLGMTVIGVTRTGKPFRWADKVVKASRIETVLPKANTVVVMAPLTNETENLLSRRRLGMLKPDATLLNMGRARIVDYDALADLLDNGQLGGALLDVFEPEPLPRSSRLWTTPNLILSPHCSSDDVDNYIPKTLDWFFANLERFLAGRRPTNRVDTRLQY
ncbi:MAG: D-2-hydroxyacid dehydrogenase [Rhodospirillaceae bacterium]|nr:D-2-hydroxyacid dehydrogenase [Rhodospirillaceae bacterium]|tara:strand:+ start:68 stop:1063 length:996 start_codon:yes stop_codon:yes gene_type:complete